MKARSFAWVFLLVPSMLACGGPAGEPPSDSGTKASEDAGTGGSDGAISPMVTLDQDIQPVFDTACTRCHGQRAPLLTLSNSREALAGKSACVIDGKPIPYVVPGHPEESFLFYKIGGETKLTISGVACRTKMPSDGPSLQATDPEAVELVRQWILAGAP